MEKFTAFNEQQQNIQSVQLLIQNQLEKYRVSLNNQKQEQFLSIIETRLETDQEKLKKAQETYTQGMKDASTHDDFLRKMYEKSVIKDFNGSINFLQTAVNEYVNEYKPTGLNIDLIDYSNLLVKEKE